MDLRRALRCLIAGFLDCLMMGLFVAFGAALTWILGS